jgi:hypothetical protein
MSMPPPGTPLPSSPPPPPPRLSLEFGLFIHVHKQLFRRVRYNRENKFRAKIVKTDVLVS